MGRVHQSGLAGLMLLQQPEGRRAHPRHLFLSDCVDCGTQLMHVLWGPAQQRLSLNACLHDRTEQRTVLCLVEHQPRVARVASAHRLVKASPRPKPEFNKVEDMTPPKVRLSACEHPGVRCRLPCWSPNILLLPLPEGDSPRPSQSLPTAHCPGPLSDESLCLCHLRMWLFVVQRLRTSYLPLIPKHRSFTGGIGMG